MTGCFVLTLVSLFHIFKYSSETKLTIAKSALVQFSINRLFASFGTRFRGGRPKVNPLTLTVDIWVQL